VKFQRNRAGTGIGRLSASMPELQQGVRPVQHTAKRFFYVGRNVGWVTGSTILYNKFNGDWRTEDPT
jgi:hypothetical protein